MRFFQTCKPINNSERIICSYYSIFSGQWIYSKLLLKKFLIQKSFYIKKIKRSILTVENCYLFLDHCIISLLTMKYNNIPNSPLLFLYNLCEIYRINKPEIIVLGKDLKSDFNNDEDNIYKAKADVSKINLKNDEKNQQIIWGNGNSKKKVNKIYLQWFSLIPRILITKSIKQWFESDFSRILAWGRLDRLSLIFCHRNGVS